jgi:MFS family permease
VGNSQGQYLTIIFLAYVVNSFASLGWGLVGDRFGWWRTTASVGCIGCAISILLFYFVPVIVGPVFWVTVLVGCFYGCTLGGFTSLTAIMPAMAGPGDRGNAMAIYTLGAGIAALIGPLLFTALNPSIGAKGVVVFYSGLYVVAAILTVVSLRGKNDPAERRKVRGSALRRD